MTRNNKSLQELTIKDNFMFTAVMSNADNAKAVLECILGIDIERVEVEYEKLQQSVNNIKASRKMRKQYMNWQEIRRNDFKEGKAEGKVEALAMSRSMLLDAISEKGIVSDELVERIMRIDNLENLNVAIKRAILATSVSEFEDELTKINL